MNLVAVGLVLLCVTQAINGAPTPCEQPPEVKDTIVCNETEYEAYRNCIEESKTVREKRQATPCQARVVEPIVQTMKPFEMLVPVPPLKVIQKPELKNLDRTIIVRPGGSNQIDDDGDDEDESFHYRLPLNVTTVIRLTNIVNNTNNIHMPTTLNNTNVNNIHVYSNLTEVGSDTDSEASVQKCCTAVRPQSCHTSTQGVRCKHRKFQTCGPQCTAKVMHVQKRKRCSRSTGECQERIAYVPQPEKPTCVYIDEWPYVVCGKVANMSIICAGCYDHYGRGYEAVHGHSRMQPQCYGCYDDAFDVGPRYRRGPVLRPFFYHQPPCYLNGGCPDSYDNCGYGCYGHERVDPAWGQPAQELYDPSMDSSNTIYYDPDDVDVMDETSYDWGVPTTKCAVVTDDNAITVKNCTNDVKNPFLAAPASYSYYPKLKQSGQKKQLESGNAITKSPTTAAKAPSTTTEDQQNEGSSPTSTTSNTQAAEKDAEEEQTKVRSTSPAADSKLDGDEANEYEDNEVEGSGAGLRKKEVSFVEEYIDDEDFVL